MKILHELNQLDKGGAERVVEGIIKHDKKNQHTVYSYKEGPMREILEAAGATVIVEKEGGETLNVNCDILHIHTGGEISRMAEQVQNAIPTVETVHSPIVSAVRDEFVMRRVGVSDQVTKYNRKCKTIYNGISFERLEKSPGADSLHQGKTVREFLGIPADAFVVGRLGRVGSDKCVEEFLLACWKVQESGLVNNMHVLIVGDDAKNSPGHLAKMKVMAASLPLLNVHWLPAVEEIGWALEGMSLFLYPSPTEGFGLVFLEAQAAGVPVLTWGTPLTREILLGSAWLSREETIQELADDVLYLHRNPSIREAFQDMGLKNALGFTEELMSKNYQSLYAEIHALEYGNLPAAEAVANG